jgi:hypothetical protein
MTNRLEQLDVGDFGFEDLHSIPYRVDHIWKSLRFARRPGE